jgi:hypothetical protein
MYNMCYGYDEKFRLRVIEYRDSGHTFRDRKIDKADLPRLPDEHPDWYLREFAEVFGVWKQSIHKMSVKPGVTCKKNIHLF